MYKASEDYPRLKELLDSGERIVCYIDFTCLVRKMREAQEELDVFEHEHEFYDYKGIMKRKELTSKVIKLESEVDEYLKKMEDLK